MTFKEQAKSSDAAGTMHTRGPHTHGPRLKGFAQLAAVLEELDHSAGSEFTTAELMQAAQLLVELSKAEYIVETSGEGPPRPNYFSRDVCTAFRNHQQLIVAMEAKVIDHVDHDGYSYEALESARSLKLGLNEMKWEF